MKNLVKVSVALIAVAMMSISCEKDNVKSNLEKTNVNFGSVKSTSEQMKSSVVNRPEDVHYSVKEMTITAQSAAAGIDPLSKTFSFVDDGSGTDALSMDTYLGTNVFTMTTLPYDPAFGDGFETGNMADREAKVAELRSEKPYLIFTAETTKTITAGENTVLFDATTNNGRLIMSFEMVDEAGVPLLNTYVAQVHFYGETQLGSQIRGTAPDASVDLTQENDKAWFYYSNESAIDGKLLWIDVYLFEKSNLSVPVKVLFLEVGNEDKITIKKGVDQYVRVKISEDYVRGDVSSFHFNFHFDENNADITLK